MSEPEAHARLRVECDDPVRLEVALAEAWEAGASGVEESLEGAGPPRAAFIYAPAERADAVRCAVATALGVAGGVEAPVPVVAEDWAEHWKRELGPVQVSPRLRIRPSFAAPEPAPGRIELVIDPGQAFGTGGHASTRLALEWLDARSDRLPGARVLDVGTGTGVLAIAALALGAAHVTAFDLDPLAAPEARRWARHNEASAELSLFTGSIEAVAGPAYDGIVANLLRRELLPLVPALAERLGPDGWLVLSGLLAPERAEVERAFAPLGLRVAGERREPEPGDDPWISLWLSAT